LAGGAESQGRGLGGDINLALEILLVTFNWDRRPLTVCCDQEGLTLTVGGFGGDQFALMPNENFVGGRFANLGVVAAGGT